MANNNSVNDNVSNKNDINIARTDIVELDVLRLRGESNPGYVTDDHEDQQKLRDPEFGSIVTRISRKRSCTNFKSQLERRLPIITWIKTYDKTIAVSDLIAGITIGLTLIPQAIAYAALAGLPSQYGLYSSFIGALTYVFFGTIKEVSIGPTSLMALLTLQYTMDKPPEFAVVLAFLAGCVELLMGILNLGFIVSFISVPVTNAFTTATSLIIIAAQAKNLLGLKISAKGFSDTIYNLLANIGESKLGDGMLGIICCVFLLAFKELTLIPINTETKKGKILKKAIWYLSISRNALIVLITSYIAYSWTDHSPPFNLSGKVKPGIPSIALPPFSIEYHNHTASFIEICSELGSGILVVPIVAVLANVAIAKVFTTGAILDASQEMLTLGLCNFFGSFFMAMPTCGAFTRSAVSHASGVRTPFAGLYSAVMIMLALSLLTPYFYFIPKSTLGSVLICAVLFMIDIKLPIKLWQKNRNDFYAWLGTIIICLMVGVEIGLLFGIIINSVYLLYFWARPVTSVTNEEIENVHFIRICPNVGMFFPAIDALREIVNKAAIKFNYSQPIVLDCSKVTGLDYTSAQGLNLIIGDLLKQKQFLIMQNLDKQLHNKISEDAIFCANTDELKEFLTQQGKQNGTKIFNK